MKGLLFYQQLEIRLEVDGEEFHQGDSVPCVFSIKNRGSAPQKLDGVRFQLALGDSKKVKQKTGDAFSVLSAADCPSSFELAAGEEWKFSWTFALERNAPISEKSQSPYIVYGLPGEGQANLQLNVLPHSHIEGILLVFETSFQFVLRQQKWKSGWTTAILKPPAGRRFLTVESLELSFQFSEEKLLMKYRFKVKKLEASATDMTVQKKQQDLARELERKDYMSPAGYIDSALLEPAIEDVLSTVGSKF